MYVYILQATNLIKEFAIVTIIDRIVFILLVLFLCLKRTANFNMVIISDLLGRGISLVVGGYFCKEVVLKCGKVERTAIWKEIWKNIISGSQLMFANLASSALLVLLDMVFKRIGVLPYLGKYHLCLVYQICL